MNITINTETASPLLLRALAAQLAEMAGDTQPAQATPADPANFDEEVSIAEQGIAASAPEKPDEAPTDVELDSTGLPWDVRIHSREKTRLKKDDTWRKKQKVDPTLVAQVEAELRAAMAATPAPVTPAATAPVDPAQYTPPVDPAQYTPPVDPAQYTPPVDPAPAAGGIPTSFPAFMQLTAQAEIDSGVLLAACQKHGIASTALLASNPAMIPTIYAEVFPGA